MIKIDQITIVSDSRSIYFFRRYAKEHHLAQGLLLKQILERRLTTMMPSTFNQWQREFEEAMTR